MKKTKKQEWVQLVIVVVFASLLGLTMGHFYLFFGLEQNVLFAAVLLALAGLLFLLLRLRGAEAFLTRDLTLTKMQVALLVFAAVGLGAYIGALYLNYQINDTISLMLTELF